MDPKSTHQGGSEEHGDLLSSQSTEADDKSSSLQNFLKTPAGAVSGSAAAGARPYAHKLAVYAERFGQSERSIKRWIAVGRSAKPHADLPPLDRPEEMASWWSRNMRQRVPERLLALVKIPEAPAPVAPPAESDASSRSVGSPGAIGMLAALERLRLAEEAAGRAYAEALAADPPDIGKIEMRQRAWERLSDALRKAEKDAGKILVDSGELMPTGEVRQVVQEIFGSVFQTWRQFCRRVRPLISGKNPGEQDVIWDRETDAQFEEFQRHPFFEHAA